MLGGEKGPSVNERDSPMRFLERLLQRKPGTLPPHPSRKFQLLKRPKPKPTPKPTHPNPPAPGFALFLPLGRGDEGFEAARKHLKGF